MPSGIPCTGAPRRRLQGVAPEDDQELGSCCAAAVADELLARPAPAQRLVAVAAERDGGPARLAIENAPSLERLQPWLFLAMARGMARARHLDAAPSANAQRVL